MADTLDCILAPLFTVVDFALDAPAAALAIAAGLAGAGTLLLAGW